MSRELLPDPLSERRLQELERLGRIDVADLLVRKARGRVIITIDCANGQLTPDSAVTVEEKPLTRSAM